MMGLPRLKRRAKSCLFEVDGKDFIAVAGEVHNSDGSSIEKMEKLWGTAEDLGLNTLLVPVSWELIEQREDVFDFTLVSELILQARRHMKKLIFLWFGSWKNATCSYAPSWVKTDIMRFKRAQIEKGKNNAPRKNFYDLPYTSLSYLCEEGMRADAKAFARLMKFLRDFDGDGNTVIAVQVENETGLLGAAREVSDEADALFASAVPQGLVSYLKDRKDELHPQLKDNFSKLGGSWAEVFGVCAEEVFSACHIAKYVEYVAAAGKREYPLPMLVNCWLDKGGEAGQYPSGGPIDKVREVWEYCAPSVDAYCPDIYVPDFCGVCDKFSRGNRPLGIPECAVHSYAAPRLMYVIGHHHGFMYAPFGFDDIGKPFTALHGAMFGIDTSDKALKTVQDADIYSYICKAIGSMMPLVTARYGTEDLQAVCAERGGDSLINFGNFGIFASFEHPMLAARNGALLAAKVAEDECFILAYGCGMTPVSVDKARPHLDILDLEEGCFSEGKWICTRRLNGDEAAYTAYEGAVLLRLKVFLYN